MSLPAPTAAGEAEAERDHISPHPSLHCCWPPTCTVACCELCVPSSSLSPSSPAPRTGSLLGVQQSRSQHASAPEPCQLLGATAHLCPRSPWADVELRPAECPHLGLCAPGKEPVSCWALSDGCLCAEAVIFAHWKEAAALISTALADLM